jgi:hypothetical protein
MDYLRNNAGSGIFIQIGAGAGDQDSRANYRDGFTELVKSLPRDRIKKIILVEPNKMNIPSLKTCWKDYPNSEIYTFAIVPKNKSGKKMDFFYCLNDGPHFQVASINKEHVKKHYPNNETINTFSVDTIDLETFLFNIIGNQNIELLSLDIEGIDSEILLDTDFQKINIDYLSYEYIHNGENEKKIQEKLKNNGFIFKGLGVDHNGYDYLFTSFNISNAHYRR